jgi:CHAD domain-containing protein
MAFRLKSGKSVAGELSRVVTHEFRAAIQELKTGSGPGARRRVHAARKHVKKMRAVLRLLQKDLGDDYRRFNGPLRRVAHRLSPLRDEDASTEVMKDLHDRYPRIITPSIFRSLDRGLKALKSGTASHADRLLAETSRALRKTGTSVPSRIRRVARRRAIGPGVGRAYRRARKEMARVVEQPEDLNFHAWRRRVKDHWYHMRLIEGLHGRVHHRVQLLKHLETWLGDDHNLVVLRNTILEAPTRFGGEGPIAVILGCITKYQAALRRRALKQGRRLFARTPSAFRKQAERWLRE